MWLEHWQPAPHLRLVCVTLMTLNVNINGGCVRVGLGVEGEVWAEAFACLVFPNGKCTSVYTWAGVRHLHMAA